MFCNIILGNVFFLFETTKTNNNSSTNNNSHIMAEDCSQSRDSKAVFFFFPQIMSFPPISKILFFKKNFFVCLKFPIVLILMNEFSRKNVNNEKSQFANIFLHVSIKCKDWLHESIHCICKSAHLHSLSGTPCLMYPMYPPFYLSNVEYISFSLWWVKKAMTQNHHTRLYITFCLTSKTQGSNRD